MGKMQRDKGQRGEREFFGLLSDHLGTCVRRNVDQTRNGGADGIEVPGWAIEVKRWERGFRAEWWEQACRQASIAKRSPALAYRASHQPWRVRLRLCDAIRDVATAFRDPCSLRDADALWVESDLMTFVHIVRESLPAYGDSYGDSAIIFVAETRT